MCEGFLILPMMFIDSLLQNGEIDIIEGVHDNQHNQVAWHTGPGASFFDLKPST